ncbi:MAG TPA: HlyD family secretion protein [Mesorhizobium sp.]|jgi:membrane fusion protein, multidrug efflux system
MTAPSAKAANINEKPALEASPFPGETKSPIQPANEAPQPEPRIAAPEPATPVPAPRRKRRFGRVAMMALVPLALVGGGSYIWATGGRYEETENANLRQARITIASEASGRIVETHVTDNQTVKAGDTLFVVDPEPYRIALAQADAALAAARLNVEQLRATYSQVLAQEKVEAGEVDYFQSELDRQTTLTKKGVGTQATLDSARRDLLKAQDQLAAAQQSVVGAKAALGGDVTIQTDKHPAVLAALAQRDKAAYDLKQTSIVAPADGVLYQAASFRPGQLVAAGTPLFSLVETGDTWVDANFKETQLTHIQLGQAAEITLDTFPDHPLHATVDSIGAGTGAEFSLLPAQNATGNWVKVTQRIPVRLKVSSPEAGLMLRTGMSADVEVDTGHARGWGSLEKLVKGWL